MTHRKVIIFGVLAAIMAWAVIVVFMRREQTPVRFMIVSGMSREEVIKTAGEPKKKRSLVKSKEIHEDNQYWLQIPAGTPVEVWEYHDRQGRILVYFTNAAQVVSGVSFLSNGQPF